MFCRRIIHDGDPIRVYKVVKNIMSTTAELGHVLVYATGQVWTATNQYGLAARYHTIEAPGAEFYNNIFVAGVVDYNPIAPGENGVVVCHGFVRSVLVDGLAGVANISRAWSSLVLFVTDHTSGDISSGALYWTLSTGGLVGTYMPNTICGCAKMFVPASFNGTPATASMAWLPVHVRLM